MYKESQVSINNMILNKKRIDYEYSHPDVYSKSELIKKVFAEVLSTLKKSGVKRTIFRIKCQLHKEIIFDKEIKYDSSDLSEIHYAYKTEPGNKKVAVYTAIFGGYDELKEPEYLSPVCDYYIFTDREIPKDSAWKKIDISSCKELYGMDAYHKAKYVKIFPNRFFETYDYSIWVDGTTTIVADLYSFIDRLEEKAIGMFDNPVHDCIYTEANFLIYYGRVQEDMIRKQISFYMNEGYPRHNGMFECTVIARKHCDKECIFLMEEWWKQITAFTMRDQISFPFVLWKNNARDNVIVIGENRNFNPRLRFDKHTKTQVYKR